MAIYSFSCRLCWTSTQVSSMYIIKEPEGGDYGDPDNFIGKKRSCWIACKELRFRSRILLSSRFSMGLIWKLEFSVVAFRNSLIKNFEDHHLYSLNCMHFGAPKFWYGVSRVMPLRWRK
ncbi:uncharacterized protein [Spinacia oleracea]|uniref:Uncharacterized protein isoform X2 n=1 Tax=Spinacia oleracea TaxID=3562 RepID=A0ABM3RBN9_SPIOL|nr:uncharacterized protein LOC130467932 isoform X2 [Spinacia oleracea]